MALMNELVDSRPSYFEEGVEKPIWEVVSGPKNKLVLGLRWIFKVKHATDGSIENYKARVLAKGYSQVDGG